MVERDGEMSPRERQGRTHGVAESMARRIGFLRKLLPLQRAFEEELHKKASAKNTPSEPEPEPAVHSESEWDSDDDLPLAALGDREESPDPTLADIAAQMARGEAEAQKKRKRSQMETPSPVGASLIETSMDPRFGAGGVALLAAARERCELRPKQFFVAWSGALTLAWHGFPPEIEALKRDIASAFPALKPENPGSRWAKTTLGCLRDTKRLTPEQLERLGNICARFRSPLNEPTVSRQYPDDDGDGSGCVPVDTLSVITYECRSLERVVSEHVVRLQDAGTRTGSTGSRSRRRLDPPSAAERAVVDEVVAQFSDPKRDAKRYFFDAARDGSRESHYRGTKLGVTLAARVAGSLPRDLKQVLSEFRERVDDALPDMYAWFDDESLHCTVRGLVD